MEIEHLYYDFVLALKVVATSYKPKGLVGNPQLSNFRMALRSSAVDVAHYSMLLGRPLRYFHIEIFVVVVKCINFLAL